MLRSDSKWQRWWLGLALALATVVLFWPATRYGFIRYDDPVYVRDNPRVTTGVRIQNLRWAFTSGHASNWHPVTWISHMADAEFFGSNPQRHHLTSVLLHGANAFLLFLILARVTGCTRRSLVVAGLFALHPLRVESVAWIAERKDVLSMFFFLLMLGAYSRYASLPANARETSVAGGGGPRGELGWYLTALSCFSLGLMSKPMLVTVPFLLLLVDLWPLRRVSWPAKWPEWRWLLLEKVPFLALTILSSWVTFLVQDKAHAVVLAVPLGPRLANAVASYWKYLFQTVWPVNLAVFYPHPDTRYPLSEQWPLWVILVAGAALVAVCLAGLASARRSPWFTTGWFWFLGTLVPVIGVVQVGAQAMADRYTYLPHVGLFLAIVWTAAQLAETRRLPKSLFAGVAVAALLASAGVTRHQLGYWRDTLTLFRRALVVTKTNAVAHCNIGYELGEQGNYDEAISHFKAAIQDAPATADAYSGLGFTYELQGKLKESVAEYRTALRLRPWDEWTLNRLGMVLWQMGERKEAMERWREAARMRPDFYDPHFNLGAALASTQDFAAAEEQFRKAVALRPESREALGRWAELCLATGRLSDATLLFRRLVELEPKNADFLINLAGVLWRSGQRQEAAKFYMQAVEVRPDYPLAHFNLATAFLTINQFTQAEAGFRKAVELLPDYPDAQVGLGRALMGQGKLEEAIQWLEKGATGKPNPATWLHLGRAQAEHGEAARAISSLRKALELRPDWPQAMGELAWVLATTPQASLRNGAEALALAKKANDSSQARDPELLAALDAALAETGDFPGALRVAEECKQAAVKLGLAEMQREADQRLELYRQQRPFRTER